MLKLNDQALTEGQREQIAEFAAELSRPAIKVAERQVAVDGLNAYLQAEAIPVEVTLLKNIGLSVKHTDRSDSSRLVTQSLLEVEGGLANAITRTVEAQKGPSR